MTSADWPGLARLESRGGLRFGDPALAREAMTHSSYVNEHDAPDLVDNERLEFLGDSVLGLIVADWLFRRFPDMPEGEMTALRAALVRADTLARLAVDSGIDVALRMGRGEEAHGGRRRTNVLSDAFEALLGALFVDQGLEAAREFAVRLLEPVLAQTLAEDLHRDARSVLQEWSQATFNHTPQYRTTGATGPDHEKQFLVEVTIGDDIVGTGVGRSKQTAAQAAARDALARLRSAGETTLPAE